MNKTNKTALINEKEWNRVPLAYNLENLIQPMTHV